MPRSRNIKYSFFTNDELAEHDPLERLFFIGLWTIADHKGDIEWRPKRIKAQILPYDNCNLEEIAINLDKSGFIRTYSCNGQAYINITNFLKHQNPHKNERDKGSDIPAFAEDAAQVIDSKRVTINRDKIESAPDKNGSDPADSCSLIPDSLLLIPDSRTKKPTPSKTKEIGKITKRFVQPSLAEVQSHINEKGYQFDAEVFIAHYTSNDWKVGKNKMKCWKSACVTWGKRESKGGQSKSAYQQRVEAADDRSFNIDTNF